MKMLVADPEVSRGITESLAVAVPATVEELSVTVVIRLHEYPAARHTVGAGRFLRRDWKRIEKFFAFLTSCKCNRPNVCRTLRCDLTLPLNC